VSVLITVLLQITALQQQQVFDAANKLMPGVAWKQSSVRIADFTCRGRKEQAILGTVKAETAQPYGILAVFLDDLTKQPELLRDPVHVAADLQLNVESLDHDPKEDIGDALQGFQRSKMCKGLNLTDSHSDSLHTFWNHKLRVFDWWRL
jgi:hypothetical protein